MNTMNNRIKLPLAMACAALSVLAADSHAALVAGNRISVSFGSPGEPVPSGAAVIGVAGDQWNGISASAGSNVGSLGNIPLNLVNGASSGVGLSVSTGNFNGSITDPSNLDVYEGNIYLDGNGQFGPTGPATFTFSGLGAGTIVNLYLYGGAGHTSGEGAAFTIGATTKSLNDANGIETGYSDGVNYVVFTNLVANGSGVITGTWSQASGQRFSSFAGLQIEAIPEPSAAMLGIVGVAGLALSRRRA